MSVRDIGTITASGRPAIAGRFHTLVLQPTSFCNLDCAYCYLPDRRSSRLMSVPVATACARSIEQQASGHPVSVVWHGGEPTATPIAAFRELLAPFERLRRTRQVRHEIQTNATLINRQWCELFAAYEFDIGVSIDGPDTLNGNRLDRAGNATTARTIRGMRALADTGLTYSVICVVTPETVDHADDLVEFFTDLRGCDSVGFNIEEQEGAARTQVSEEAAYRFWHRLVWHRLAGSPLRIRDLDRLADYVAATRAGITDDTPYEPIPTVSHDGQMVLLSPELLGIKDPRYADFIAGNVLHEPISDMLTRASELRYVTEFVTALNGCADRCVFYDFCRGAQAGNRYFEHRTFAAHETAYCRTTRQALIRAAADRLTPQGGPP